MEAEEDDHSNVNKPSLQVEHGSAQSDAHVEDPQSGEQQCKFESFSEPEEVPLVIGGQSEPTLVSVKNDGDVFSGEDSGAVGADVEIKKTNLVENMELAEKIGADMGESTVEEVVEPKIEADMVEIAVEEIVEAKSETFVAETDVERQNYVADVIAGAVEDEKVAPHVTESSVDETFAADGPEEKEVELAPSLGGVSVDKEMTEGESVANEVNDTRLVDMGDGVQYTEKIGVTNEVEETNGAQKEDDPDVEEKAGMEKEEFLVMEGRDSSFPLEQEKDEVYAADLLNGTLLEEEKEMFNVTEESSEAVEVNTLPQENAQTREKDYVEDLADKVGEISNVADETVKVEGMANVEAGSLETEDLSSAADEMAELEEMANGEDETTEAETMAAMGDEAVEMANMGDDTIEAVEMANVGDETIEAEEMEASVNDMVGEMTEAEETEAVDEVEEMEVVEEASRGINGSKRKRGKNAKAPARALSRKKVEEDVCFICFDGGDLVLCDRRGCPKAYHPSCVNRDDAFFRAKGRWNCGWHLCSNCQKTAYYMCYTCTFSLCKSCIKDAVIFCVRGNKGFCETCMKTIMLIEKKEQGNVAVGQVDFDDRSSFEYLFKDYWTDLKEKLSLTFDELAQAKNPWKGHDTPMGKQESPDELYEANVEGGSNSDSSGNLGSSSSKRRKTKKRLKSRAKVRDSPSMLTVTDPGGPSMDDNIEWASKELLEFVMHMRNGDKSVLSQFDVQALLLEYIKRNKLRDPCRKSQIICDSRLESLFGKPRVGHFEMLKLLESHFFIKEDSQADDLQGSVVDTESSQLEADGNTDTSAKAGKDRKRKGRKKSDERGSRSNLDDYAAIDIHNINLIYLRRNLVEDLIEDMEKFHDKVVGSFVRIRISGSVQKQDLYRLVQVVGTCKAGEPYKVGKKITDTLLEILNLNKTEIISMDIISNQEFTEDECKRLRQSIKCGLLNRLTVGDIQEKAIALQEVRVKDWLETETVRLSHLRDRASEKGRRKELRECVEKLQLLKTPEERQRRLEEIPEIHADPNMDPSHESEEDVDDTRQESYLRPRGSGFGRRGREPISPHKGGSALNDTWSGMRNFSNSNWELNRNLSNKGFTDKGDDVINAGEIVNENSSYQGRETDIQSNSLAKQQLFSSSETGVRNTPSMLVTNLPPLGASKISGAPGSTVTSQNPAKTNEAEKTWHYKDPSEKVQGPFSIVQLRKWSNTGYFPADLRIWRTTEKQDDSILLTDALSGKLQKDISLVDKSSPKSETIVPLVSGKPVQQAMEGQNEISSSAGRIVASSVEVSRYSVDRWASNYSNRNEPTNLPSPTPSPGRALGHAAQSPTLFIPESAARFSQNSTISHPSGNPVPNTLQMHSQSMAATPALSDSSSMNPAADIKSISANLQSLVQSMNYRNPPIESQGWGSSSVPKTETSVPNSIPGNVPSVKVESHNPSNMPPQLPHGHWVDPSSVHNSAPFSSGNQAGNFPTHGFSNLPPSDPWRPPVPSNQPNIPTSAPPNLPLQNQNPGWGPLPGNPNMSWVGPVPGNVNQSWGPSGQNSAPGIANHGWGALGNATMGWVPHNQAPLPANVNPGWINPGQGPPPPGNTNPSWGAPPSTGNQAMWGSEQSKNADGFPNHRDRGGGDSGYGGGNPRNRKSSFGNGGGGPGPSRTPTFKGQRVCKYHESGHCKKGASCDYLHT